ncbi:hypothetical protein EDD17DRAFT_215673 [Pisolithus thermaeus]|nr:hypothetical protein EDD17DRAFT_215673 [Pisolithus thermaeus]
MEPELAADGCNWHTYGSWVLKSLSEDDLLGYLEGSETRPTHPSLLQEAGDGWTPQTDEEREAVAVWRTADNAWQQRASMAHYLIISGIPDSILMLVMHFETPRETFAYLESRYGRIPRPESPKVVDEANRERDLLSEQCATEGSAQSTENSNNEPENSPGSQGEPVYSPSDCAEITKGHLEPEMEIIDAQQVDYLPMVEVGVADSEVLNECTNALDAPGEGSQWASDEAAESQDLPESSSKTLDSVGNAVGQAGVRQQMPIEDSQCLVMDDETVANVPDPPTTHYKLPTSQIRCPTRTHSATSTKPILPVLEPQPKEPDKAETGGGCNDAVSRDPVGSQGVKKTMLADSRGQHGEHEAKRLNHSPAPPTPLPKHTGDTTLLYRVPRRRERLKSSAESVSNAHTRQNAYCVQVVRKRILPCLSMSTKRLEYLAGGSWMVTVRYNKVRHVIRVETRGYTHRGSHTNVSSPHKVLQHLWNVSNTLWMQGVPHVSTLNDARWPTNLPMAKQLPVSSSTKQGDEHRAKRPNDLPAPSKPTRIDFPHPPGTLRDARRRGRIKTDLRNICNAETRGRNASILTIPIPPPRKLARTLWNVADTYWRHGIPPGRSESVENPLLFETAASRQRYKARGRAHSKRIPEMAVATTCSTATATSRLLALHKDSKLNLQQLHSFI